MREANNDMFFGRAQHASVCRAQWAQCVSLNRCQFQTPNFRQNGEMKMLGTILLIVLVLALVGALPAWPHSRSWGYYPSSGMGLVLIIVVVLLLAGRI